MLQRLVEVSKTDISETSHRDRMVFTYSNEDVDCNTIKCITIGN